MEPTSEFVLATLAPWPSIWGHYSTAEAAAAKADEANAYWQHIAETQGTPPRSYEPMSFEDYLQAERQFYLSRPLEEITQEKYREMLEVLPPNKWHQAGGLERFLMSEHWSGPYTSQYAFCDGRYFTRMVDALDQSTWITRDEIEAHLKGQPQTAWQRRVEESKRNIEPSR
jgi:hypothetical protein